MKAELIRIDGGTQPRAKVDETVVAEYAEAIRGGVKFPELVVFSDGADIWLADGFHRYHAYRAAGIEDIPVCIRNGTRRDAVLFSVGANAHHGLRRTNDDKRKAVQTLLADAEWAAWSDREIARQCNVHHQLVSNLRRHLDDHPDSEPHLDTNPDSQPASTRTVSRGGKEYQQDTSGVAKSNKKRAKPKTEEPEEPAEDEGVEQDDVVEALLAENAQLKEENAQLKDENATLRMAAGTDNVKTVEGLKAYLAGVESQRDDYMNQCNSLRRHVKALQRRLGE